MMWCNVWVGGGHGINDGITISITNAGAKIQLLKNCIKVHLGKMDFLCHLDLVSMIFMDSYIGACHLGKMDFLCHLAKMACAVKVAPTFVT